MRKSNWIIIAILVLASIIFLIMWNVLGFNLVDSPTDIIYSIIWWIVIIGVCVAITLAENKRRKAIRTAFIAPGVIYNSEAGIVKVEDGANYVATLENVLSNLKYNDESGNVNNDTRIHFKYIIHTDKFSDNGSVWQGDVVSTSNPDNVRKFSNEAGLARLLSA